MPQILIVEDEAAIADTLIFALQSEGFATHWLTLASAALAYQQATPADLWILDVGLPDLSGFEACKQLRRFSEVPVLFLTARNAEIDRVVGLEIGADDYVTKPFSPREVAARVKAILKRTVRNPPDAGAPGQSRRESGFVVDEARAIIRFQNQPLDLTRYEYLILKTLLAQPERVFSRAQLMDRVWPDPDASFERSVDTHIKTLRAKLRDIDANRDPIRTHRGLGYSIRVRDPAP